MRSTLTFATAACLITVACGSTVPARIYSSPAPANALDCSLRTLAALGYNPIQGGVSDGFIKFDRRSNVSAAASMASRLPGVSRPADGTYMIVTSAGGNLRVAVSGYHLQDAVAKEIRPGSEATGHAEALLATCANPSTHDVGGNPTTP